jgi:hypothetical protein
MAELQASRFAKWMRELFNLTDRYALTLLDDVFPVFPLEDPSEPHFQHGKEVAIVAGGITATPAATDVATIDLGPGSTNSKALLDVVSLTFSANAALTVFIEHLPLAAGSFVVGTQLSPLDGRRLGDPDLSTPARSNFVLSNQIAGFTSETFLSAFALTVPVAGVTLPFKATLYRSRLRFKAAAINVPLKVSVLGLDRLAEPAEERRSSGPGGAGP